MILSLSMVYLFDVQKLNESYFMNDFPSDMFLIPSLSDIIIHSLLVVLHSLEENHKHKIGGRDKHYFNDFELSEFSKERYEKDVIYCWSSVSEKEKKDEKSVKKIKK